MEAIVLAGGFGTRLGPLTETTPKPMLPVAGRPFLVHLLDRLSEAGVSHVVLSVGYLAENIISAIGYRHGDMRISYALEDTPLGTGGGIANALRQCEEDDVLCLNGDTYLGIDYERFEAQHHRAGRPITIALHWEGDVSRYGSVELDDNRIVGFREKGVAQAGWINAGVYYLKRTVMQEYDLPERFSFETDFLERYLDTLLPAAYQSSETFIDIGIPEDLARAQDLLT